MQLGSTCDGSQGDHCSVKWIDYSLLLEALNLCQVVLLVARSIVHLVIMCLLYFCCILHVGTCINNTGVFMFKKGCFELGATIYPVVIKVCPLNFVIC